MIATGDLPIGRHRSSQRLKRNDFFKVGFGQPKRSGVMVAEDSKAKSCNDSAATISEKRSNFFARVIVGKIIGEVRSARDHVQRSIPATLESEAHCGRERVLSD
jgi:hypothetical protein